MHFCLKKWNEKRRNVVDMMKRNGWENHYFFYLFIENRKKFKAFPISENDRFSRKKKMHLAIH